MCNPRVLTPTNANDTKKMKINLKKKNLFSLFLLMLLGIGLLPISSCQLFETLDLEEDTPQTNVRSNGQEKAFKLVINPQLEESSQNRTGLRSAYPDLASELSHLEFFTICSTVFDETKGVYDDTDGTVTFTIPCPSFSNKTINFFARDTTNHSDLLWAQKTGVNYTLGSDVTISSPLYFKGYTSETGRPSDDTAPNGHIDLQITSSSGSKVVCNIYKPGTTPVLVSGASGSGKAIEVTAGVSDNECTIHTVTAGIEPGQYTAKIFIYKDGHDGSGGSVQSNPDYREETINVWPGTTTSRWHLSNGTANQNYNIVPTPGVKFYVKGTNPSGPYASGGVSISTSAIPGSIKNPFTSIATALAKCTSSDTDYRIIICGKFDEAVEIGGSVGAKSITFEGATSPDKDIIEYTGGSFPFWIKRASINLKNLQVRKGVNSGIYIQNVSSGSINIEGCKLCQNEYFGALYISSDASCDVKVLNCEISGNSSGWSGAAGGISILGSGRLEIENTTISGNSGNGGFSSAGGIYIYSGTVIMNSVVLSENSNSNGGGAINLCSATLKMGGSMYIPFGVTEESVLVKGKGKNDIAVQNGQHITVTGKLLPPAESNGIVAYITPGYYNAGPIEYLVIDTGVTDTNLEAEASKFEIVQRDTDDCGWRISATTGKIEMIKGKQAKPRAVGDIVFNDGSAMPYSDFETADTEVQNNLKNYAIALIFYKGRELNDGSDTTTERTIGVGLKHSSDKLAWCTTSALAYGENIAAIISNIDKNGSDNLTQIATYIHDTHGEDVDDTGDAEKYPAFHFAINYKSVTGSNLLGSAYEDDWYLPSSAEFRKLYENCKKAGSLFDIDEASDK